MANSVVHFEVPADDVERAKAFYQETFGWKVDAYPGMNYHGMLTTEVGPEMTPLEPGAINGGMFDRSSFPIKSVVLTIGVDDIDAALAKVESNGGKVVLGRQPVTDMGFTGYFADPEGNVMGLWQNA